MPAQLDDLAHRLAGDDARARRAGISEPGDEQNTPSTWCGIVFSSRQTRISCLLAVLDRLLDRASALPWPCRSRCRRAVAIADDGQRTERETPTALDHRRRAVDGDDVVLDVERPAPRRSGPWGSFLALVPSLSELQARFARGVGQRLHATMVLVGAAIERDLGRRRHPWHAPPAVRRPSRPRRTCCMPCSSGAQFLVERRRCRERPALERRR